MHGPVLVRVRVQFYSQIFFYFLTVIDLEEMKIDHFIVRKMVSEKRGAIRFDSIESFAMTDDDAIERCIVQTSNNAGR